MVTTCPTCGSVRVYWGSTLLRTISLRSTTGVNPRVITVANFVSVRAGTYMAGMGPMGFVLGGIARDSASLAPILASVFGVAIGVMMVDALGKGARLVAGGRRASVNR